MNAGELLASLSRGPDTFLQDLDFVNRRGLLVQQDQAALRRAPFLDQRALTPGTAGAWFPLPMIAEQAASIHPTPPHAIFHVSHCGSTLVSRLLGELPGCLPLREPVALLALAVQRRELDLPTSRLGPAEWDKWFDLALRLLSRSYGPEQRVIIKATSAAANLLMPLQERAPASRALLLYVDLERWLATMLRDEQVRENGRFYAPAWLTDFRSLTGRSDLRLTVLSEAEQFALNWLTGMLHFQRALEASPERNRLCDFEAFLADPASGLRDLGGFFGLETARAAEITGGPLMQSYAKNTGQPFDAAARRKELEESRKRNAAELEAGLKFAEKLCREISSLEPLIPCLREA
ncbi:MAG TPA: hypothetical protein VF651_11460 [Gammaproteobacteria bacterium]